MTAWLNKYTDNITKAQNGLLATRKDSLNLQKNYLLKEKQLEKLGYVRQTSETGSYPESHDLMYNNFKEIQNKEKNNLNTQIIHPEGRRMSKIYPSNVYREENVNNNPNLYKSQEAVNIGVLNPQVPYSFYDKRIAPTKKDYWLHSEYNDGIVNYGYDFEEKYKPVKKITSNNTTNLLKKDIIKKPIKKQNVTFTKPIDKLVVSRKNGGIIEDDNGQWSHPGSVTKINSNNITMRNVKQNLLGISNTGDMQLMFPEQDYKFKGKNVTEFPIAKNGKFLAKNWLDNYQDGGEIQNNNIESKIPFTFEQQPSNTVPIYNVENKPDVTIDKENLKPILNSGGYTVEKGDTLSKIAKETGSTVKKIALDNNIKDINKISIGKELVISNIQPEKIPQKYQDWNVLKKITNEINKLDDLQKITNYYKNKKEEIYSIVDKKNSKMNIYKGDTLIKSFEIGSGTNKGDAQTVTKINKNGKTDWDAGNKSTGAGIYTISNIDPSSDHYFGLPSFNLKNEQGIEVATSIHGTPLNRRKYFNNNTVNDNRMSNGCINGKCEDLPQMYKYLDKGSKVYVLPEDKGNKFEIVDGKPVFRVDSKNAKSYENYTDKKGVIQKGQGVNRSINTLVYKPIKEVFNESKFKDEKFTMLDFNDEDELKNTVKPFIKSLSSEKQRIMKAAKIPSDVYNELAKMAFGILGTESNYGDTHSAIGNFNRTVNKVISPKSSSSPDYKSKATTYGADENTRSVGLTQIRWSFLNDNEKNILKTLGIKNNTDFLNPKLAAIGTTAILATRYNEQLTTEQKKDVWKYLPTKWNKRENYVKRVKENSSYLNFKQLDNVQ